MSTPVRPSDFWRLAEEAQRRGIRILIEHASREHYATSGSDPHKLYRVTGFSCTCPGFIAWQRCTHHAALLAVLGWLPDPEPEPSAPAPALAPPIACPYCHAVADSPNSSSQRSDAPCPVCGGNGVVTPWSGAEETVVPVPQSGSATPSVVRDPWDRSDDDRLSAA